MLSTRYKAKLPKSMSYPIGAQALSDALGDIPQLEIVELSFHTTYSASRQPGRVFRYPVLEAEYHHYSRNRYYGSGRDDSPKWDLIVNEVPRPHRHKVRTLLDSEGLMCVRDWFHSMGHVTGQEAFYSITLLFDETQQILEYESRNRPGPRIDRSTARGRPAEER